MPVPRHCPHCGATVETIERCIGRCSGCGREVYANSKPTAGLFIERAGKVLLTRRALEPAKGRWDVPGGFLEEGELPEDGARREAREELGWELGELRFALTNINQVADVAILDLMYETVAPPGEPVPADDVAEVGWFALDALPDDLAFPSTRQILERWRDGRRDDAYRLLDGTEIGPRAGQVISRHAAPFTAVPPGWSVETGAWSTHNGLLCGKIAEEGPAVLWHTEDVEGDHMIVFTACTIPPHSNDINCYWEGSGRLTGDDSACTIAGFGGWWDGLTGIERFPEGAVHASARLAPLVAGRTYELVAGRRGSTDFLFVDGRLAMQIDDPAAPRRGRSRVALATWNSHVHFSSVSVHALS